MQPTIESPRFIIRELLASDVEGMFELDSNPNVHRYLHNQLVSTPDESSKAIEFVRKQYDDNDIGRWAVIDKVTGEFVGWTGFKLNRELMNNHINFHDLGYRFIERYWGQGIGTETSIACLNYAFNNLSFRLVYGMADVDNIASNRILTKLGMIRTNTFDLEGVPHHFYKLTKAQWQKQKYSL